MNRIRPHISGLLIAVLVLTGHSMAIARGMSPASGWMELCTGTGPAMIAVDENGVPTGHSHICPDFSLSLMDAIAPPAALANLADENTGKIHDIYALSLSVLRVVATSARAPPELV